MYKKIKQNPNLSFVAYDMKNGEDFGHLGSYVDG